MICPRCRQPMLPHRRLLTLVRCGNPQCSDFDRWHAVAQQPAARVITEKTDPFAVLPSAPIAKDA